MRECCSRTGQDCVHSSKTSASLLRFISHKLHGTHAQQSPQTGLEFEAGFRMVLHFLNTLKSLQIVMKMIRRP